MAARRLQELNYSQRDRLTYVDLRARFFGAVRRQDLVDRFGIQTAAATRDLSLYRELAPESLSFDHKSKAYKRTNSFRPLFEPRAEQVMSWLCPAPGDSESQATRAVLGNDRPATLTQPDLSVLACLTQAIHSQRAVKLTYHSITNGRTTREIVPFALVDSGLRWHVRAFDRKSAEFRDFVITRIKHPVSLDDAEVQGHERADHDIQWTRIVELDLVPHPDHPHPEISEMDFGMRNGALRIKLRAAVAGYALRRWSVDCTPDHRLRGHEYRLWLRDPLVLYGVKNALLAPGYPSGDLSAEAIDAD